MDDIIGEHLPYEIWMLAQTFDKLARPPRDYDAVEVNALIESFCAHTRNLFEFLQKPIAAEYCKPEYKPLPNRSVMRRRLNQQITHLIHGGRVTDPAKKIDGQERLEMLNAVRSELENFRQHLLNPSWATSQWDIPHYVQASGVGPSSSPSSI